MNEVRRIAKIYFDEFEGFHLYSKPRTRLFYAWLTALFLMLVANVATVILVSSRSSDWYLALALVSDAFFAIISQNMENQRNVKIQQAMNKQEGHSFDSLESCKRKRLCRLLGIRPEKFLQTAEEIISMRNILTVHDASESNTVLKLISQYLYDSKSKDRILNLCLVFVGVIVTLAATGQANLENIFEAFSSESFMTLIALLEMLAIIGLLLWAFLHTLWYSMRYSISHWYAKVSKAKFGGNAELAYMVCDLVRLHKRPPLVHIKLPSNVSLSGTDLPPNTSRPQSIFQTQNGQKQVS